MYLSFISYDLVSLSISLKPLALDSRYFVFRYINSCSGRNASGPHKTAEDFNFFLQLCHLIKGLRLENHHHLLDEVYLTQTPQVWEDM